MRLAVLFALPICGCNSATSPSTPSQSAPTKPRKVFALGYLEPAGGLISISGAPGDRLKKLDPDVEVGKLAPKDGLLGVMSSLDAGITQLSALKTKRTLAAEKEALDIAAADAQVKAAEASLAQAVAKQQELKFQEKRISYLTEAAAIAQRDLDDLNQLYAHDSDLVTPQQIRRQANEADKAQKELEIARDSRFAALSAAQAAHDAALANKSAAKLSREKLKNLSSLHAIDQEIALARHALSPSLLLTPGTSPAEFDPDKPHLQAGDASSGPYTVLRVFLRPGEAVTRTPVLQVGDLSSIVCVAEVYEADAKRITLGQVATLTSDAFDDDFAKGIKAKVVSKSRLVASPGLQARNPLAPVDRSVVEVRVAIDPKNAAATSEAGKWIGLQVKVAFDPSSS